MNTEIKEILGVILAVLIGLKNTHNYKFSVRINDNIIIVEHTNTITLISLDELKGND